MNAMEESNLKGLNISIFKTFENLMNFSMVFLFIYGIFLFDSLEIIIYGKGILGTNFSCFFKLSAIPFFLLFLVTFGVIFTSLSCFLEVVVFKFSVWLSYIINLCVKKFPIIKIFFPKSESKIIENSINICYLKELALTMEKAYLLDYIEKETKKNKDVKKNHRIIYSLLIALILNWFVMILYDKKTILDFFICIYKNDGFLFIKICLSLFIISIIYIILIVINHSNNFDDKKINFPDAKYKLLVKKMNSGEM
jgi:hypothetical protein